MPKLLLPLPDELEVSVFGPGVGESIVIHTGDLRWIVIDSCRDSRSGYVAPLDYLRRLGLNPAECVDWVIATHAHDDHIAGFADVVRECSNAEVVLPAASDVEEFLALSDIDQGLSFYPTRWTVLREYQAAFAELERPNRRYHYGAVGTVLPLGVHHGNPAPLQLTFLAPSAHAVTLSKRAFARLLTVATQNPGGRVAPRDPNTFSIAVLVTKADWAVLCGGDVRRGSRRWGWRFINENFPHEKTVTVHKVSHHGSKNAYRAEVWDEWLSNDCVNVLAPYRPSALPRSDAVAVMKTHGLPIWATAKTGRLAASSEVKRTRVLTREVATSVDEEGGIMGQVQFRRRQGQSARVETMGPAFRL